MQELQGEGFRVTIESHGVYLRAFVHDGEDSLAVSIAVWTMLVEQCRLHGATRLLVVEDLAGSIEQSDIEALSRAQVELGLPDIRVAFVDLHSDAQTNELSELALREQDVSAQVFGNENAARQWLLYGIQ